MKKSKVTTAVILESRKTNKDGKHPVKLRVTHQRKRKYYTVQDQQGNFISMTPDEWNRVHTPKPRGTYKDYQLIFAEYENRAKEIIQRIENFDFLKFDKIYFNEGSLNVLELIEQHEQKLIFEEKFNTKNTFFSLRSNLTKFLRGNDIPIKNINIDFLKDFEKFLREKRGVNDTTVGILQRTLRIIWNQALSKGYVTSDLYPFGKNGYKIPKGKNIKKALEPAEIKQLMNYQNLDFKGMFCRDLWIFSFFGNGMNIKDICHLKQKNLSDNFIVFRREKTKNKSGALVKVPISEPLQQIINDHAHRNQNQENYLFPIFTEQMTPLQKHLKVKSIVAQINKTMKNIAKDLGIRKNCNTYSARHSYASILKRSGAPVEFISESLGHSDLRTTQNYLADFADETKRQWANTLTKIFE